MGRETDREADFEKSFYPREQREQGSVQPLAPEPTTDRSPPPPPTDDD